MLSALIRLHGMKLLRPTTRSSQCPHSPHVKHCWRQQQPGQGLLRLSSAVQRQSLPCNAATGDVPSSSTTTTTSTTTVVDQKPSLDKSPFCRMCGSPMSVILPEGDTAWRHVCSACSYVDYFNPKLVVGAIVEHQGKILLCKRAIQPCAGLWTVPAGFLEIGESCAAGAMRETWEEAAARVEIISPYTHLDIPVIGQAYILFRARLAPPYTFCSGPESLEVELFDPDDIPFDRLAFSSVAITLRQYLADRESGRWHVHHGVIVKVPGSAPNDPNSFSLQDHFAIPVGGTSGNGGGSHTES